MQVLVAHLQDVGPSIVDCALPRHQVLLPRSVPVHAPGQEGTDVRVERGRLVVARTEAELAQPLQEMKVRDAHIARVTDEMDRAPVDTEVALVRLDQPPATGDDLGPAPMPSDVRHLLDDAREVDVARQHLDQQKAEPR